MILIFEYRPRTVLLLPVVVVEFEYTEAIQVVVGWLFWSVTLEFDRVQK